MAYNLPLELKIKRVRLCQTQRLAYKIISDSCLFGKSVNWIINILNVYTFVFKRLNSLVK